MITEVIEAAESRMVEGGLQYPVLDPKQWEFVLNELRIAYYAGQVDTISEVLERQERKLKVMKGGEK